ncbi:MAG TPA: hypothetical protein VGO05_05810, partial [Roseiarcus sp.]|nr:hypothetical protein [Roseiarcus sp.]
MVETAAARFCADLRLGSGDREDLAASAIGDKAKAREAEAIIAQVAGSGTPGTPPVSETSSRSATGGAPCGVPTETNLRSSDANVAVKSKDAIIQPVKPSNATFSFEVRWVTPPSETSISLVV